MRHRYYPQLEFTECLGFRGKIDNVVHATQATGEQAVVFMWRKEPKLKFYTAPLESFDFSGFDPTGWSIVLFYNRDGSPGAVRGQRTARPPRKSTRRPSPILR